jgi:hypothetical protein
MAGCGRGRRWPWLDATGFGRSGWWRSGVGEAGGVLRASDSSGGELVGAPLLFPGDDVGSALPWWWGWGVVQVLASGSEVGLRAVLGLFRQRRCESVEKRASAMAGSMQLAWC